MYPLYLAKAERKGRRLRAGQAETCNECRWREGRMVIAGSPSHESAAATAATGIGVARSALRREKFARPLRWLRLVVTGLARRVPPQSQLGKACSYLLNHWEVLVAHQDHSFTRIDINRVENAIRPSAIGKKNSLFIGHPAAGQRSAIIYSLVVSCQRHGKDPLAYLRDVLARLRAMSNQDDLTPLTPAGWHPA